MTGTDEGDERVVVVCGAGVAGSTAAAAAAHAGAFVVVLEAARRPYGKLDQVMPEWQHERADDERAFIDLALAHPNILFVPATRLGIDVDRAMLDAMGVDLLVLAHGAERERALAVPDLEAFAGRGFATQRDILGDEVPWPTGVAHPLRQDGALVVGGGLGAVDCAKALVFGVVARALAERQAFVPYSALEAEGVHAVLARHHLDAAAIGLVGAKILHRRDIEQLRLDPRGEPVDADVARAFVDDLAARYAVEVIPDVVPVAVLADGSRLTGLACERALAGAALDAPVVTVPGSRFELHAPLVVSAIGWRPALLPDIPSSGDFYRIADPVSGEVAGIAHTLVVGMCASGRGGLEDTRAEARARVERAMRERFGMVARAPMVDADATSEVEAHLVRPPLESGRVEAVLRWARARQRAVGFQDYRSWIRQRQRS
ncbi:MAG: FAD-dependent oxidoreductase [Myxococcota bacterium]